MNYNLIKKYLDLHSIHYNMFRIEENDKIEYFFVCYVYNDNKDYDILTEKEIIFYDNDNTSFSISMNVKNLEKWLGY